MTTLINNFHRTEYSTRKSEAQVQDIQDAHWGARALTTAEKKWSRMVRTILCGSDTCTCSGMMGERA